MHPQDRALLRARRQNGQPQHDQHFNVHHRDSGIWQKVYSRAVYGGGMVPGRVQQGAQEAQE